jgi:hypothetical protein
MVALVAKSGGIVRGGLSFDETRDNQSLRRAEIVPFDIGQGFPVLGIEQAKHFALDRKHGLAGAQPISDTVADLNFVEDYGK